MELIRGKQLEAIKCLVYGPEGIGKSTFASQFPDPVFIDTEGSTTNMNVIRTSKPSSWTMLIEQVKYFIQSPQGFKTLVIDTADWAERLCTDQICASRKMNSIEDAGYGRGYVYLAEEFGRILNLLDELRQKGVNIVLTAHAQMRKFEQPDELGAYDRWELKLQKKTAPMVKEWADMVLFANYETFVVNVDGQGAQKGKNKAQGGKRVIYTTHHSCWDAKNRHGLPDKIPMEYSAIAHCIPILNGSNTAAYSGTPTVTVNPPTQPEAPNNSPETQEETKERPIQQDTDRGRDTAPATPKQEDKPKKEESGLPKNLLDLMQGKSITEADIMEVVAQKGYFPADTPLVNCGTEFINGWLIPFFDKVYLMSRDLKMARGEFVPAEPEEMPFN